MLNLNPLTAALAQGETSQAADSMCTAQWTVGTTSASSLGFYVGGQLHSSMISGGLIWQSRGTARTKYGALAKPAEGMLRGEPCSNCRRFQQVSPTVSSAHSVGAGWVLGEGPTGNLVFERTETRNEEQLKVGSIVLTLSGQLWGTGMQLAVGEMEKYHPVPEGIEYVACNGTQSGSWLMGQSPAGHFLFAHNGEPVMALLRGGQIWTRGSGMLETAATSSADPPGVQNLVAPLQQQPFAWPSAEALDAIVESKEITKDGVECGELWELFEFGSWATASDALPGNAIVAQKQYCVKGTWSFTVLKKHAAVTAAVGEAQLSVARMEKHVVCVNMNGPMPVPTKCCVKKFQHGPRSKSEQAAVSNDDAQLHLMLM